MSTFRIAVIPGDGIGTEVTESACKVLDAIGDRFGHTFTYKNLLAGGCSIDEYGVALTPGTLEECKKSDSVLLGAVGGPKWDDLPGAQRPERALLDLRGGLELFANLRPAILYRQLASASPLKEDHLKDGIDIMIVRELTGGLYFGDRGRREGGKMPDGSPKGVEAYDTEAYSEAEIERIVRVGFELAMGRKKKLTSVDKANILESSRLWREVNERVAKEYPEVEYEYYYVDNASMQLVRRPGDFDVMVTTNMFGDIISDEAGMITGSIGMLPSASLGKPGTPGMYEPVHGSAPDIAGQDKANPCAAILSAAMMLRWSFGLTEEADCIEKAIETVLENGYRTPDIAYTSDCIRVGTQEMTSRVIESIV
ncbi:MAG: 3-isopropylmalate dehydrogenase [Clostridiales bacterium]|nr:3-isopropylmalate dehydrogenase [Clostridiales bacterium]